MLAVTVKGWRHDRGEMIIILYFVFPSDFSTFSKLSLMNMYCFYNENNK